MGLDREEYEQEGRVHNGAEAGRGACAGALQEGSAAAGLHPEFEGPLQPRQLARVGQLARESAASGPADPRRGGLGRRAAASRPDQDTHFPDESVEGGPLQSLCLRHLALQPSPAGGQALARAQALYRQAPRQRGGRRGGSGGGVRRGGGRGGGQAVAGRVHTRGGPGGRGLEAARCSLPRGLPEGLVQAQEGLASGPGGGAGSGQPSGRSGLGRHGGLLRERRQVSSMGQLSAGMY